MSAPFDSIEARLLEEADFVPALHAMHGELRALLGAERITVFELSDAGDALVSLIATGLEEFTHLALPLNASASIAAYAAVRCRLVNVADAYDEQALARFDPPLRFFDAVDRKTGFRTRQVIAAPIFRDGPPRDALYGVLQVLNRREPGPFTAAHEETVRALCVTLVRAFEKHDRVVARGRRYTASLKAQVQAANRAAAAQQREQEIASARRRVAELRPLADQAMRDDAPEAAALAREELLQMYRERLATRGRLDIEWKDGGSGAWDAADVEALGWLCRLGTAGHCGAARLVDRALQNRSVTFNMREPMQALGRRFPRVARHIAADMILQDAYDLCELAGWLERAGGNHARIAAALREAYDGPPLHRGEYRAVSDHVMRAEHGAAGAWPQDLMADIALHRLLRVPADKRPAAWRLLERAAELGSRAARDELWMQGYTAAPDKDAFVREWLRANPSPHALGERQAPIVATTMPTEAALPWYAATLGFSLPAPDACNRVGEAFEQRWNDKVAALAWYEHGVRAGELGSLQSWLGACFGQRLGVKRDGAAALVKLREALAAGLVPGPALVDIVRRFRGVPGEHWDEFMNLGGYTPELRARDDAEERANELTRAASALRRAEGILRSGMENLAQGYLREALRLGDDAQRARAQEWLEGRNLPAWDAGDVAHHWELFEGAEQAYAAGKALDDPARFARKFEGLARQSAAQADPRLARLQALIVQLNAPVEPKRPTQPAAPPVPMEQQEAETETQFNLAEAYREMGDTGGAAELLREVLRRGSESQRTRARQALADLGEPDLS